MKLNEVKTVENLREYIINISNYRDEQFGSTENFLNALEEKCQSIKNVDYEVTLYRIITKYEYEDGIRNLGQSWVEKDDIVNVPSRGDYVAEITIPANANVVVFKNELDGLYEYVVPNAYKYNPDIYEYDIDDFIDEEI